METDIQKHYHSDHLTQNIKDAYTKAGKDLLTLDTKELSPIDQLHTGGAMASIELMKKTNLFSGALVLDAGCGIGGTSRLVAQQCKCRVIGIDLSDPFIEAADFLTRCTKLEDQVTFQQGSVLDLPFEDHTFDAVLCQHVLMNIENKSMAIKEFYRVLKPEGKLILHEIFKGNNNPVFFPVPWAGDAAISFLEGWDALKGLLENQGFEPLFYLDETPVGAKWWEKVNAFSQKKPFNVHAIGPGLVLGSNAEFFGRNMHANFTNKAIGLVEAVLKKGGE